VLPVHTWRKQMDLSPLLHAGSFAVVDRGALEPYLFGADRGDAIKYFHYRHRPYMPDESWYGSLQSWHKATARTFEVEGQRYRWRFHRQPGKPYWNMVDLVPVDWNRVACDYDFLLLTKPFNPGYIQIPTRMVASNESAALLAVDKRACHSELLRRPIPRLLSEH
jgi:hypothetical protein